MNRQMRAFVLGLRRTSLALTNIPYSRATAATLASSQYGVAIGWPSTI
jgi:hypothetical protein